MFSGKSVRGMVMGLAVGATVLAGCMAAADEVRPAPAGEDPSQVQDPVIVTEPVVYESREVVLGEAFEIVLEANATTGYSWELIEIDDDVVQLAESEYIADPNSERLVGKVGKTVFHFQAVGRGETTLKWVRRRPWEKDVGPMRAHIIQVTIL